MIKDVPLVGVFVNDQEAALDFYANKLGLKLTLDQPYGEGGAPGRLEQGEEPEEALDRFPVILDPCISGAQRLGEIAPFASSLRRWERTLGLALGRPALRSVKRLGLNNNSRTTSNAHRSPTSRSKARGAAQASS